MVDTHADGWSGHLQRDRGGVWWHVLTLGGREMAAADLLKWRGFGPRRQVGGAMAFALLCIAAWTSRAYGGSAPSGVPRTEYFIAAGVSQGEPIGLGGNRPWTTIQGGGDHCVTSSVAVGVATGWSFIGTRDFLYLPPGGNFLSAKATFAMIPAIGYVKVRLPMGSHGGVPYVMAGAGSYTLLMRTTAAALGNLSGTRLGFSAAIGLAASAGKFSPRVEARYDSRSTGPRNFVIGSQSRLDVFTVSLGLQLP